MTELLAGIRVVELGACLAVKVCGRLYADLGAHVTAIADSEVSELPPLEVATRAALGLGKSTHTSDDADACAAAIEVADLIITSGQPGRARELGLHPEQVQHRNANALVVHISPFGLYGERADEPASDLTLFAASAIAQLLIGQVDDPDTEPPQRAIGEQSAFVGGSAAAAASVNALLAARACVIDVSLHEVLATLAITELTRAANGAATKPRLRDADGNGATVCILPCVDGYVAISAREEHQWAAWLGVMRDPEWAGAKRFSSKSDRVKNWDQLHALMCTWSCTQKRADVALAAQQAHVPSFPLNSPAEQLTSSQLQARGFFLDFACAGAALRIPSSPFAISANAVRQLPLETPPLVKDERTDAPLTGVRVLDFSWVIAGPTTTRYLAALGAEVIKVEAPGAGDPARTSELHTVLGQSKRAIVLDLKKPAGADIAARLAARSDVLIENFASGVMERFGLGAKDLLPSNPHLSYVSASGMGREGPQAKAVAYGTLLQCYSGFAELNGVPGKPPRVGMAWLDPMCALMLTFITGASVHYRRRTGIGTRVDFSMVEAMLWSMLEPLLEQQLRDPCGTDTQVLRGNRSASFAPHNIYRAAGDDKWVAIAVCSQAHWQALCSAVPSLESFYGYDLNQRRASEDEIDTRISAWTHKLNASATQALLCAAGVPAAALAQASDLAHSVHLHEREFWQDLPSGRAPRWPWRMTSMRTPSVAPALGADTDAVMRDVLGLRPEEIAELRAGGAFGRAH